MNVETIQASTVEGPPPPPPPGAIVQSATIGFRVIYAVTLLLGLLWLASNCRVISSDSQAVVLRFGRVVRVQKAGLLLAWPRPIENVLMLPGPERQLTRQVGALPAVAGITQASTAGDTTGDNLPPGAAPYMTGDGKVVLLDATLVYRITNATDYVLSEVHVAPAVDRIFRSSAVTVAAGQKLSDFLVIDSGNSQNAPQTISAVRDRLQTMMNARLKSLDSQGAGLGIEIDRIDLTPFLPPAAKLSFDSVLVASQKAEQNIAAANTAAELRRQGSQREADRLTSAAQAVAIERGTNAQVQTTSITAIEKADRGARTGLEQQAYRNNIGSVLAKAGSVIVVDPQGGQRLLMSGPARPAPAPRP
jgi:regulator of protease activity HflC (stomatin/prohibitin superfamily)